MMENREDPLDDLLSRLPRDVPPARDLWSGIVRDIGRGPDRYRPFALAATVIAACLALALSLTVHHGRPAPADAVRVAAQVPSFVEPRDPALRAARAELQKTFNERLALLDPATRGKIEASLAIIRKAHEDMREALAAQPANPILEQLLESTWRDEFDLYDDVVRNTQPAILRS